MCGIVLNVFAAAPSYKKDGMRAVNQENDREQLARKIVRYKELAREAPDLETTQRITILVEELEQKLREIDG